MASKLPPKGATTSPLYKGGEERRGLKRKALRNFSHVIPSTTATMTPAARETANANSCVRESHASPLKPTERRPNCSHWGQSRHITRTYLCTYAVRSMYGRRA